MNTVYDDYKKAKEDLVFLDYDGTLAGFIMILKKASP